MNVLKCPVFLLLLEIFFILYIEVHAYIYFFSAESPSLLWLHASRNNDKLNACVYVAFSYDVLIKKIGLVIRMDSIHVEHL